MKAQELYKAMMRAANSFGLAFYELDLIKVEVRGTDLVFSYYKDEFVFKLEG